MKVIRVKAGGMAARSGTDFTWSPLNIAPVKKFVRVRLSTIFLQNKYGGECRHGGTMSFCSVLSFPASKHQEKVFKNIFNGIFGHQKAWCVNSSWVTTLTVIRWIFRVTSLVSISYIFPPTVVLRIIFLILNICYKLTIKWVLQQLYGNVH